MTIQFQIRGMKDDEGLRRQVEVDLESLNCLMAVTSAHVALQCQHEVMPAHQAVVDLAVSGPNIHAAARDHTWPAAWQKVVTRLREQIEQRRNQQTASQEGQAHIHHPAGMGSPAKSNDLGLAPRKTKTK